MKTSYFTFGSNHTHPISGRSLKDNYIKITAENPREVMFKLFGDKWSFEYDEKPEDHPFGYYKFYLLIEIKIEDGFVISKLKAIENLELIKKLLFINN